MRKIILASVSLLALTGAAVAAGNGGNSNNSNNGDTYQAPVYNGSVTNNNQQTNSSQRITNINYPLSNLQTIPSSGLQLNGAVAGFASKHEGFGNVSGATNNGKIEGKTDFSGVSQVGTAVRTDVVRDAGGNPVRLTDGSAQTITNPIAGVMTGTSGSQVGGSAALTTNYGNVSGNVNTNATSQGAAGGFTLGGQVGSISQIR